MTVTEQNLTDDLNQVERKTEEDQDPAPAKIEEEEGNQLSMVPDLEHFCQITEQTHGGACCANSYRYC